MGYSIRIGERYKHEEDQESFYYAEEVCSNDAPPDGRGGYSNERLPSYGAMASFAENTGLHDLFFNKKSGLLRKHPGCVKLTIVHQSKIRLAMLKLKTFSAEDQERLRWFNYWVGWAIVACKYPVITNS